MKRIFETNFLIQKSWPHSLVLSAADHAGGVRLHPGSFRCNILLSSSPVSTLEPGNDCKCQIAGQYPIYSELDRSLVQVYPILRVWPRLATRCWSKCKSVLSQYVSSLLFPYLMPVVQISLSGSIWSIVAVAWERFVTISPPDRSNNNPIIRVKSSEKNIFEYLLFWWFKG